MSRIRISIPGDALVAEVQASPGPAIDDAAVRAELANAGVVHGLDDGALRDLALRLQDPGHAGASIVARGVPAEAGEAGRVTVDFPLAPLPGQPRADGGIDYHERAMLHPVAAGTPVGTVVPPTPGRPGVDVRGKQIPAKPGQPHKVRIGPGVRIDAGRIVAVRGGVLLSDARQLDVVPLYSHAGDVDLHSGNLHTEGSLQIRGDVREGFSATASGDVQVGGAVLDAKVAAGGSVRIEQGVLGASSEVRADEDIACRHATSATLEAGRTIDIGDQATHCRLRAQRIQLLRGRGRAFGGELRARTSIDLRIAGTAQGATTVLSVGDLADERTELARRTTVEARAGRTALRVQREAIQHVGAGKASRLAMRAGDHAQQERLRVLQRQRELLQDACIHITELVHPGVRLQFGDVSKPITEARVGARFRFDVQRHTIVEEPLP